MKNLLFILLMTIFCLSINAQQTTTNPTKDSLGQEIIKAFKKTKWDFTIHYKKSWKYIKNLSDVEIENDSLIFNFNKIGIMSISLIETELKQVRVEVADGSVISIGQFQFSHFIFKNRGYINLTITHPGEEYKKTDFERTQGRQESKKLYDLLIKYRTYDYLDSIAKQRAKELEDFTLLAQKYHATSEKPTLTEEQRKYIVQANAANKEMNYEKALELYTTVAKINATTYPEGYYNMALIAAEMKNYDYAIFNMKKYLILSPEASDARAAQDKIYEWEYLLK